MIRPDRFTSAQIIVAMCFPVVMVAVFGFLLGVILSMDPYSTWAGL
jgi:hypothetical protein